MVSPSQSTEYEELRIELTEDPESPDSFRTRARYGSGKGEECVEARHTLGFSLRDVEPTLKPLARALRGARLARRYDSATDVQLVGSNLFESLFSGALERLYTPLIEHAEVARSSVRIRLLFPSSIPQDLGSPQRLPSLPWESMYDVRRKDFVTLMRGVSIVRGNIRPGVGRGLTASSEPPEVLLVASDLADGRLGSQRETAILQDLLRSRTSVELLRNPSPDRLRERLRATTASVVHIINTVPPSDPFSLPLSAKDGAPIDYDRPTWFSARELTKPGQISPTVQLVFINACHSASMAAELSAVVPAVVGVQGTIVVERAVEFARAFYQSLFDGATLDDATGEARRSVDRASPGEHDWALPLLITDAPGKTPILYGPEPDMPLSFGSPSFDPEPESETRALQLRARQQIAEVNIAALEALIARIAANAVLKAQLERERLELDDIRAELSRPEAAPESIDA